MSTETPCSTGNPDDWFIEKDGKQYRDDEVLTVEEGREAIKDITTETHGFGESFEHAMIEALQDAADEKIRQALIRRRKARDACYECPVRLSCLDVRLTKRVDYGIWGGYYPEELRLLETERERQRLRHS